MMLKSFVHTVATPLKKWGRTCPRGGDMGKRKNWGNMGGESEQVQLRQVRKKKKWGKIKNGEKWEGEVNKWS
jgi:hypothetical protein